MHTLENKKLSRNFDLIVVFFIYMLISYIYFGMHVIPHMQTRFAGDGGDTFTYIWMLKWLPHAIKHGLNPFITNVVYAPSGINLTETTSLPGPAILYGVLHSIFGITANTFFNFIIVFSPGLAAWTTYILCRYISKAKVASLFGGYFFGFSAYTISHMLGHFNLIAALFTIPLGVYLVIRLINDDISQLKFFISYTVTLAALFLTTKDLFLMYNAFGFLTYIIALMIFKDNRQALLSKIKILVVNYILIAICISPIMFYFITVKSMGNLAVDPKDYANDLLNFIIPTQLYAIKTQGMTDISNNFVGNLAEKNAYLGIFLIIILNLFTREYWKSKLGKLLVIITLITAITSLGPQLRIAGIKILTFPWQPLFYHLPFIKNSLPQRWLQFGNIAIAIMVTLWLAKGRLNKYTKYSLTTIAIIMLIPSFHLKDRTQFSTPILPRFFKDQTFKKFIKPHSTVLFLPTIYPNETHLYWQSSSNYYFNMINGFGMPPTKSIPFLTLYTSPERPSTTVNIITGLKTNSIDSIVVMNSTYANSPSRSIWDPVINKLNIKPITADGFSIYNLK